MMENKILNPWKQFNIDLADKIIEACENLTNLDETADKINDCLPHGSGIDLTWDYTIQKNGIIKFKNSYHVLNDVGYYVYWIDFNVKIKIISNNEIEIVKYTYDRNIHKSDSYGINDYIEDTIYYALTEKFKVI